MVISIVGSGNVAQVLAGSLFDTGHVINEICGRNKKTVRSLASKVHAAPVFKTEDLQATSDLYIIAVNDNEISHVAKRFPFRQKPVVHTSGACSLSLLKHFKLCGVFYPVNTITAGAELPQGTPFCIEANSAALRKNLKALAHDLKGKPYLINGEERLTIHLAAVFTNNFTNALYEVSYQLLKEKKIPFNIVKPIAETTFMKGFSTRPSLVQTGPALRNDNATINKHLTLLKSVPMLGTLYKQMSKLIGEQHLNK